ncbi:MAG: tetratricopeptide repeat protein [Candidatus Latescibacterota bacterium]
MLFVLRLFLIPLVTVVQWGCGGNEPSDLWEEAERATADQNMDQAVDAYSEFVRIYPQHEKAPAALKNWAAVAQQKGDMQSAITLYERLLDEYPQSDLGDEAQFMIAFIYEEYLNDIEKARGAYQRVIDHYPNSELAASAKQLLPHVGQSPEEWVHFQDRVN